MFTILSHYFHSGYEDGKKILVSIGIPREKSLWNEVNKFNGYSRVKYFFYPLIKGRDSY